MSWPNGVSLVTGSVGDSLGASGESADRIYVAVVPVFGENVHRLVWSATGTVWDNRAVVESGTPTLFVQVPQVDQAGFVDGQGNEVLEWYYLVEVIARKGRRSSRWTYYWQPRSEDGANVDLDTLGDGILTDSTPTLVYSGASDAAAARAAAVEALAAAVAAEGSVSAVAGSASAAAGSATAAAGSATDALAAAADAESSANAADDSAVLAAGSATAAAGSQAGAAGSATAAAGSVTSAAGSATAAAGSASAAAGSATAAAGSATAAAAAASVVASAAIQSGKLAPVGSLAFSTTGVTGIPSLRPWTIGNDGVVYGRYGAALIAARTNAAGTALNGTVDFATKTEHGGVGNVRWATKTEAGYVVITAKPNITYIWFSTSWTLAGFSLMATIPFIANDPLGIPQPAVGSDGKTVLFCAIWSGLGGVDNPPLWASYDGGATWSSIKTKATAGTGPANNHWHTALYHVRWARTWVSGGDGVNSYFGYSDDKGVTWHDQPTPADSPIYDGLPYQQPTVMVGFDDRIALGPDRGTYEPGVWDMDPLTGKTVPRYKVDVTVSTADKQYPIYPLARSGNVAYIAYPASTAMPVGTRDHTDIVATGDGGRSWYNVARIPWSGVTTMAANGICGPDANGYLYMVGPTGLTRAPALTWQPA